MSCSVASSSAVRVFERSVPMRRGAAIAFLPVVLLTSTLPGAYAEHSPNIDRSGGGASEPVRELRDRRLLHRPFAGRGPLPLLRIPALAGPGAAVAPSRGRRGVGLRRGAGRLPRHRDVLLVQLGDRTVR